MDFSNRSAQSHSFQPTAATGGTAAPQPANNKSKDKKSLLSGTPKWYKLTLAAFVVVGVLLLLAVVGVLYTSKPETQGKYVDSSKLQAVFLNSGQVYFGNIHTLNNQYVVLGNVYYLQSASTDATKTTAANSNISLVKLGCELHQPYDQMVINRDQVTFWENLKTDGQVAKAVADFKTKYPNGQQCSTASAAGTNVQGTATTPATTTKP
ncbi:MAG: hypothetical protein ABIR37_00530 [Candidatus Saccharimonadales bacterium]